MNEVRLKDGWSNYKTATHLKHSYNTIKNEIERGTVLLYNGKVKRYKTDIFKEVYLEQRQNSRKSYRCLETSGFLQYVVKMLKEKDWSLDGHALENNLFSRDKTVCTKNFTIMLTLDYCP